jgi:hypothetical protein
MKVKTTYEWAVETMDQHGDIIEVDHTDDLRSIPVTVDVDGNVLTDRLELLRTGTTVDPDNSEQRLLLVLVRDKEYTKDLPDRELVRHRDWFYVENGCRSIDDSEPMPPWYLEELNVAIRRWEHQLA